MHPKNFYHFKKSIEPRYSYIPTRHLNVNRLIKGLAYWQRTIPVTTRENKRIVIADWTARNWPSKKREAVAKKLYELINDGFNIYVWQSGQIEALTQNNLVEFLTEPQMLERMSVPAVSENIEATVIHDLPNVVKDEILILDDYYIECLLHPELLAAPRELDIAKLLKCQQNVDKLIPVLEKAKPPITCFVETDVSEESDKLIDKLRERLPQIPIKTHFRSAKLSKQMVTDLLTTGKASIGRKTIHLKDLQLLENVVLDGLSGDNCQQLFPLLKNVKKLDLLNFKPPLNLHLPANTQLRHLEKIRLLGSTLSGKDLADLMSKAPNLRCLDVNNSTVEDNCSFESLKLNHFETIKLQGGAFSKKNYQELLKSNSLKELCYGNGTIIISNTLTEMSSHDLSSIKTLEINNCTCDAAYLNNMFIVLPQLEHVTIIGGKIAKFTNTFTLKALKTLKIDLDRFNDIASAFDNISIERLTLIDNNSSQTPNLDKINLNQLKHFSLNNNKINQQFLKNFLEKAISLRHLDLQGCTNLNELQHQLDFAYVDTLNLSHTDVTEQSLKEILLHAQHLKRLDLTGCKNLKVSPDIQRLLLGKRVYYPDHVKIEKRKPAHFYQTLNTPNISSIIASGLANSESISDKGTDSGNGTSSGDGSDNDNGTGNGKSTDSDDGAGNDYENGSSKSSDSESSHNENDRRVIKHHTAEQEPKAEHTQDADTTDTPNQKVSVTRIFYSLTPGVPVPYISEYRLNIFNDLEIAKDPCSIDKPFHWKKNGDLGLEPANAVRCPQDVAQEAVHLIHSTTHHYYYGKKKLDMSPDWQPLPSLSPDERLTHYHLEPNSDIEIQYSTRDNQYYVRSKHQGNQTATMDFILEVPKKTYTLPKEIQDLVEEFTGNKEKPGYGSGPLTINKPNPNGFDYMDAIITQKKGACRHRTAAFKRLMQQHFPNTKVRAMQNGVHMQAEVLVDGHWVSCNLGGYPVELKIDDSNNPKQSQDKPFLKAISDQELFKDEAKIVQYLQTWKKSKQQELSPEEYCTKLLEPRQEKKFLIEVANKKSTLAMVLAIKAFCKKHNKPLFYVDKPEDLICSAPYLTNQNNKGVYHDGPGGPLHQFLTASYEKNNPPIVLLNYDQFDADDIVNHNSLFEDKPKADGIPLPPGAVVLNLMNMGKSDVYQGEDLTSRMDIIESCPVPDKLLTAAYPNITPRSYESESRPSTPINLFKAENWKDLLLGQWSIDGNDLYFEEGALQKALKQHSIINIQNGLWEDDDFQQFWREALINRYIDHEGQRIHLPKDFDIVVQEGYDWNKLKSNITFMPGIDLKAEVLNPSRFNLYFSQYEHQESTKGLRKIPGIIKLHAGKTLALNLTRELNEHEWAMLLTECDKYHVHLVCHSLPEVKLAPPLQVMKKNESVAEDIPAWNKSVSPLMLIQSDDQDTTVYQLTQQFKDYVFIDVSELDAADLLERMDGTYDKKERRFEFTKVPMALNKALKENKKIILSGKFSDTLLDSLMPLLLERANDPNAKGALALVFDRSIKYPMPGLTSHAVHSQDKLDILEKIYPKKDVQALSRSEVQEENLSSLAARVRYHMMHPKEMDTSKAWDGLYELSSQIKLPEFNLDRSEEKAREVIKHRQDTILSMLAKSPMVYLSGLTGVGKTTFVEKYIGTLPNVTLYSGEDKMSAWRNDTSDKLKVLFIDEPNIGSRQWSEFEGLFQDSPSIMENGQHYLLSKDGKHVVMFGGNPLNYGSGRQIVPLFERHGNALVFEPMTGEFLYEEVMKPLFEKTTLEDKAKEVSLTLLNVYRFILNLSTKEVLISARELQLMVLLTLSYHQRHPNENFQRIAMHYAYQIGKTLVPYAQAREFDDKFKPVSSLYPPSTTSFVLEKSNFLVTPSRHEIYHLLQDILELRHFKQRHCHNNPQKFGGIGGLVLEGEPGIGKSELVTALFAEHNFSEGLLDKEPATEDAFYRVPVSMRKEEKETLLLRSLNKGANQLIDEINSAPFLERWLNDMLMGKNPVTKEYPDTPGSFLFGTQNPVTMAGRQRPSNALSRRLVTYTLPPYPQEEMVKILVHVGLDIKLAEKMVLIYVHLVNYAREHYLSPAPTFRNLLRLARIAKNSKQIEALEQFFKCVDVPSLRQSLLKAEERFNGPTIAALGKHLTPETSAIFDRHISIFDAFIKKPMSDEKVQFMLTFLSVLNKAFSQMDDEAIRYFELMSDLPIESDNHLQTFHAFFTNTPHALPVFCARVKTIPINVLTAFIFEFFAHPELITHMLSKDTVTAEVLRTYVSDKTYALTIKAYAMKHATTAICLEQILQLSQFFKVHYTSDTDEIMRSIVRAKPNTIDLLSKRLGIKEKTINPDNMYALLTHLTDETTAIFNEHIELLDGLLKDPIHEKKILFLLHFLSILNKNYRPLTAQAREFFVSMRDMLIENTENYEKLNEFFAIRPEACFAFFEKAKKLSPNCIVRFINTFINYPDLISHVLESNNTYLLRALRWQEFYSPIQINLIKEYTSLHPEADTVCLSYILQLSTIAAMSPDKQDRNPMERALVQASPKIVSLIAKQVNILAHPSITQSITALLKHLTEEDVKLFELNSSFLSEMLVTPMTDDKTIFVLKLIRLLKPADGVLTAKHKEHVKRFFDLTIDHIPNHHKLIDFFAQKPLSIPHFLHWVNNTNLQENVNFINIFSDYPELISYVLELQNQDLSCFWPENYRDRYVDIIKSYKLYHPKADTACLSDVLNLSTYLVKQDRQKIKLYKSALDNTNPKVIQLVAKHINPVKPNAKTYTIVALLKHLTDNDVSFFELNTSYLYKMLAQPMMEDKTRFVLKCINLLKPTDGVLTAEHATYIDRILQLPIDEAINSHKLIEFFAKKPASIPHFLERVKTIPLSVIVNFIDIFSEYPDLISHLLSDHAHSELLQLFKEKDKNAQRYLTLITWVCKMQNTKLDAIYLEKLLQLCKFLTENAEEDASQWITRLANAEKKRIDLLHQWLIKERSIFLNLFFSKADDLVLNNPSIKEEFIIKNTKRLQNSDLKLFDIDRLNVYKKERISLLHHLENKSFVVATGTKTNNLWTAEKNDAALKQIYANYTQLFANQLEKQDADALLRIANELGEVPKARECVVSKELKNDLNKVLNGYLGSFWIRKQRQKSARSLFEIVNQNNMDYAKILEAISLAREEVFTNDSTKERNMHRFGSSRYYDTLNKLEDMLINAWVKDKDAITGFKVYLSRYEKTLEHSKKCLDEAIRYEKEESCLNPLFIVQPGYIQALQREFDMRNKAMDKYKSLLPIRDDQDELLIDYNSLL